MIRLLQTYRFAALILSVDRLVCCEVQQVAAQNVQADAVVTARLAQALDADVKTEDIGV